jgi:hypothetical protein
VARLDSLHPRPGLTVIARHASLPAKVVASLVALLVGIAGVIRPAECAILEAPGCESPYLNPVIEENCASDPRTWSSAWQVNRQDYAFDPGVLAAYVSRPSVHKGGALSLYIRSPKSPAGVRMDVYRLGFYGGSGGRLVQHVAEFVPAQQPPCVWHNAGAVDAYYTCSTWRISHTLAVPTSWVSGIYIAVITAAARSEAGLPYRHHVIFIVRDDQRRADLLYQHMVFTEEAYNSNDYGPSLYTVRRVGGVTVPVPKVTLDRPDDSLDNLQAYRFEFPFIYWLEGQGYDVAYATDLDTHEGLERLTRYRGFIAAAHSEYWTKSMYDSVQSARDHGVHLGFFGANSVYTQMRVEDSLAPIGDGSHDRHDRVLVVYRYPYPPDIHGKGDPNRDPALQTIFWRDFPLRRDEQALVGVHYTHAHPYKCREHLAGWATAGTPPGVGVGQAAPELRAPPQSLVVTDADNWVYAGTGVSDGTVVPHVYGQEADGYDVGRGAQPCGDGYIEPPAVPPTYLTGTFALLSSSPFTNITPVAGVDSDQIPGAGVGSGTDVHTKQPVNSVIYKACSGAWVFGAGSIMWGNALAPSLILGVDYSNPVIQKMTANVLDVFSGRRAAPATSSNCVRPANVLAPVVTAILDQD